jgi:tetratricopeptide (TPR) repeat protein
MWLRHVLACAALCVVTLLAYSNSFHGGFVRDSRSLIQTDSRVHAATNENLNKILGHTYWWPQFETGLYRPISTLSYLFNYAILGNGDHPEGYHWLNFFLHFLNVVLVYALAERILKTFWPAVFTAALWAVHPVLTESVTNIIGRSDLLAATAVLSGFLMYLRSTEARSWRSYIWLAGLMMVTAIGIFSKESAVAIVAVIALYEITWWHERKQLRGLILGCTAVAPALLAMWYVRSLVFAGSRPAIFAFVENPLQGAHFLTARLTAVAVIYRYLWRLVWPATLSADYSYAQIPLASGDLQDWVAWLVVAATALMVASQFRKNRAFFFFGAFAFLTFLPASNLVILTGTIMAERLMYLPAIGFAGCLVIGLYSIGQRLQLRNLAPATIYVLLAGFSVRTWVRNSDWHDELTMAAASVRTSPHSYKTHFAFAIALSESDPTRANLDQVIEEMGKSTTVLNSLPDSMNTSIVYAKAGGEFIAKGDSLVQKGADGRAIIPAASTEAYQRSLKILKRGAEIEKASEPEYRERLRAAGEFADGPLGLPQLYEELSTAYMRLGDAQSAYKAAMRARSLDPTKVGPYVVIAQVLAKGGRKNDAAISIVEAILASGQKNLMRLLDVLYRDGVDPQACAIVHSGGAMILNNSCPVVHDESCRASAELVELFRQIQRQDLADQIRTQAIGQLGCTQDLK